MLGSIIDINIHFVFEVIIRLFVACILGGLIGFEREHNHRPAGFRTHILVCVGAALVMLTSEFVFLRFNNTNTNIDPARLGAQVISGIGFLGAGTIIRYGVNVKGLTTAASIWAVGCVGIACGIGFYVGAVIASLTIYLVLIIFKYIENKISQRGSEEVYYIETKKGMGNISKTSDIFHENEMTIKNIIIEKSISSENEVVKFLIKYSKNTKWEEIIESISSLDGIIKVCKDNE